MCLLRRKGNQKYVMKLDEIHIMERLKILTDIGFIDSLKSLKLPPRTPNLKKE